MQTLYLHPENPQPRLLNQIKQALENGAIIAYPTPFGYALLTHISAKDSLSKIARISQPSTSDIHLLICNNISGAAIYAEIDNEQFRHLKNNTPSATAFVLNATKQTPKYLLSKDKKIGVMITDHLLLNSLIELTGAPLVLHLLDNTLISTNAPYDIEDILDTQIDLLVNVDTVESTSLEMTDLT